MHAYFQKKNVTINHFYRLSEDLVNAISSRMSTGLPARGSDLLAGITDI